MEYDDDALARLILVVVTWSDWEPRKDRTRYQDLIKMFLRGSETSRSVNRAHMHQCYENYDSATGRKDSSHTADNDIRILPWDEQGVPYELPPRYSCRSPDVWHTGDDALERVESAPTAERGAATGKDNEVIHQVFDWGGLFRTRLLMDSFWYRAALGCGGDSDYWVLVDMSFQRVPKGSVLWHTSFSFWSDAPLCDHHCPDAISRPRREKGKTEGRPELNAYHLIDDWNSNCLPSLRKLIDPKARRTIRVSDRSYLPPTFLVAVPKRRSPDTAAAEDRTDSDSQLSVLLEMSNEILWTQNYESLPYAVFKGGVNAYRRFLPYGSDVDQPRYLLIPDTLTPVRRRNDVPRWHRIQEEATAVGVRILTNLEAYTATELGGIDSRLQIRNNHLKIYQSVAQQAGTLWDALARLLPDAKKARFLPGAKNHGLETVHRSIEMIHQTLLQGVADLDQLVRDIDGAQSHIEYTADEVTDRFHRQLDHPPSRAERETLRDSLLGGPIDRLRRQVREASSDAVRVTESYRTLLETIGMAFDERRVRDGDRLQRASVWLAVAFGVLGLSGVFQATLPLPTLTGHDWRILGIRWFLGLVTVGAILAMLLLLLSSQLRGQVASRTFERKYLIVRDFLADVSTDHLDNFRREQRQPGSTESGYTPPWKDLDEKLSEKFVEAWAISSDDTKLASYDAIALRSRVEAWTLQTLMLTERPRNFSCYPLPYLTSLYRVCTAKMLKDWRVADETLNAESAVGAAELMEAFPDDDYQWLLERESYHFEQEPEEIYEWLKALSPWRRSLMQRAFVILIMAQYLRRPSHHLWARSLRFRNVRHTEMTSRLLMFPGGNKPREIL